MTDNSSKNSVAAATSQCDLARSELAVWLKLARERSGLSIEAISQETRISKNYILNLEAGKLDALPGKVFGRGFVKNITRLLKSDTSEGLRLYDACWGAPMTASDEAEIKVREVHKTPSVQARIAEPINVDSPVTKRMMNKDFPQAGEKPRLPKGGVSSKAFAEFKMPAWFVRGIVSPQRRLWILAGIATVFVGLVFGRWAAGNLHKSRLAEPMSKASTPVVETISETKAESPAIAELDGIDQDKAISEITKSATAVSDVEELKSALPGNNGADGVTKTNMEMPVNFVSERSNSVAADEDNPLYMPSTGAAFEQVVEFKVATDSEIRVTLDGKKQEKINFAPDTYRYTFNERAEIYIMDASTVDVIYNGKSLGTLGSKGRKRRIFLQAKASSNDFPQ